MKVFTDCLYISKEMVAEHLRLYLIPSKSSQEAKFSIEIPQRGHLRIEMHSTDPSRASENNDEMMCLAFPIRSARPEIDASLEGRGARFLLRSRAGDDLYLRYDGSFCMFDLNRKIEGVPVLKPLPNTARVFVDCGMFSPCFKVF